MATTPSARIPFLTLGDSVAGLTGLGRIHRDIALKTQEHLGHLVDVASIGLGAPPNDKIIDGKGQKLRQYPMGPVKDWVVHELPYAWSTHTGGREGILFLIWDVSRLLWMAYPEQCPDPIVKDFLLNFKGRKWIYPAIDGSGPTGGLPAILKDALSKFDRVLNYTEFSAKITGYPDVCTHGIDTSVFYPRENALETLKKYGVTLDPGEKLIGIAATNQPRKDWALAFGALALLKQKGITARVWIHTDVDFRHWDLKSLYIDFGLHPNIKVFLTPYGMPDNDLAGLYSACDVTMGIGPEGFGYPIAESLCCGTPCITGSYGGQADFVPEGFLVKPIAYRYEGIFAIQRPVYNAKDFADKILLSLATFGPPRDYVRKNTAPVWPWEQVWPQWQKWIEQGL